MSKQPKNGDSELRIALFLGDFRRDHDGFGRTLHRITDHLEAAGVPFMVASPTCDPPWSYQHGTYYPSPSMQVPFDKSYRLTLPFKKRLFAELDRFQPTLVHMATPCFSGYLARSYALSRGLPLVATYHTHFIRYLAYHGLSFTTGLVKWLMRYLYNPCQTIFVPTPTVLAEVRACGVSAPMQLWGRGVKTDFFHPRLRSNAWREKFAAKGPIALYAGRLVKEKAPEMLAKIYALVRKSNPEITWVVAGTGSCEALYRRLMPEAHFLGHLDLPDLATAYASSDIFVYPSNTDTFANVALEAMSSGLPLVVADAGGPGDFVKQAYGSPLTVCPSDAPQVFAEKIVWLASHPEERERLGLLSRRYAEQQRWEELLPQLLNHFAEISSRALLSAHPELVEGCGHVRSSL
ncbi:MAG: glycosyltransferase family 1 protein [Deltaproteobacteria bacterium]|nr:glycosyltransferase family 1 protein [Deltaproteobacteria bacterium]